MGLHLSELVSPDAPWYPSKIEFIRRINGLPSEDAVRDIVLSAEYLMLVSVSSISARSS